MPSNSAVGANTIPVVNTAAGNVRVIVVANAESNTWTLKTVTVSDLFANSTHDVKAANLLLTYHTTPVNSTANCLQGQLWWDSSYIYLATANNTIKRVALASF